MMRYCAFLLTEITYTMFAILCLLGTEWGGWVWYIYPICLLGTEWGGWVWYIYHILDIFQSFFL